MFKWRIGTPTFIISLFVILNSTAQDTEENPDTTTTKPPFSVQDGLSRTSIMFQLGGPGVRGSFGLEYSVIKKKLFSIDFRTTGHIIPVSSERGLFAYTLGPQLQYGKKKSRLILGLGYSTLFLYGREELGYGYGPVWSEPRFYYFLHSFYQMIGYRAQHKHGFFFELSVLAMVNTQGIGVIGGKDGDGLNIIPWGGIAFGYRIPSLAIRNKWKAERPMILRIKAEKKQAKQNEKDEKWRNRKIKNEDRELEGLIGYNTQSDQQPELPFIPRGRNMFFVEIIGASILSVNYEYDFPLFRSKLLRAKARAGIAWAPSKRIKEHVGLPVSFAIGIKKKAMAFYAEGGTTVRFSSTISNYYFFGLSSRFYTQQGFSFGVSVFGLASLHSDLPLLGKNFEVVPGLTAGYRLPNFK